MLAPIVVTSSGATNATTTTSTTSSTTTTLTGSSTTSSVATTTTTLATTTTTLATPPAALTMPWPGVASAAVAVPQLSIQASSSPQRTLPVASLTKMMSAWVILHKLPLSYAQTGPCLVVNAADVAAYNYDVASGQSNVKIALNETLCEGTLLRGMLVHSAGDYVQLLTTMLHWSKGTFVNQMNKDARAMGLTRTHYVDYTGIAPGDVSTAQEQAQLAINLMQGEPIVRSIVRLPEVRLPVAGEVVSYTPFEGIDGVVGVKSGFTGPAGGCDAMAVNVTIDHTVYTTYTVVLGVHGADAIDRSGQFALTLAQWLTTRMRAITNASGTTVKWIGWPGYVTTTTATSATTTSTTTSSTTTTSPS